MNKMVKNTLILILCLVILNQTAVMGLEEETVPPSIDVPKIPVAPSETYDELMGIEDEETEEEETENEGSDSNSSGSNSSGGGTGSVYVPVVPEVVEPLDKGEPVRAGEAVTVELQSVAVKFAIGSLVEDGEVYVQVIDKVKDEEPVGKQIGDIYEITVDVADRFTKAITISLPVEETLDMANLNIYYYHEEREQWINIGGTLVNGRIEVSVDHLTKFAVFERESSIVFTDIAGLWSGEHINALVEQSLTNGYKMSDGTYEFKPLNNITRIEFAKFLSEAMNLKASKNMVLPFEDVKEIPEWGLTYVEALYEAGVVKGSQVEGALYFNSNEMISRQEVMVMIARVLELSAKSSVVFADNNDIASWAEDSVKEVVEAGIINGYNDNTVKPLNMITRGEVAKVIMKIYEYLDLL